MADRGVATVENFLCTTYSLYAFSRRMQVFAGYGRTLSLRGRSIPFRGLPFRGRIRIPTYYDYEVLYLSWWRGGVTGKAFGLAISRSQVQILLGATLRNNLRQVVYTYVLLSPSSITWYRLKGGDALRLGR